MADWYTVETARAAWSGAPMDDDVLQNLLDASKEAVLAYAPALPETPADTATLTAEFYDGDDQYGGWTMNLSRTGNVVTAALVIPTPSDFLRWDMVEGWRSDTFTVFWAGPDGASSMEASQQAVVITPSEGFEDGVVVTWYTTDPFPGSSGGTAGIPVGWAQAHLLQARNIWNATRVDPAGQYGTETFQIAAYPLDWQVKQLIRPKRAVPVVG